MKRPGKLIKRERKIIDKPPVVTPEQMVYNEIKNYGHLTMRKLTQLTGMGGRSIRFRLVDLVAKGVIKSHQECPKCGANTTYSLK